MGHRTGRVTQFAALIQIVAAGQIWSADKPDWIEYTPVHDNLYHHYLGQSGPQPDRRSAVAEASAEAWQLAAADALGIKLPSAPPGESWEPFPFEARLRELGRWIEARGFEQYRTYTEEVPPGGRYQAWVLYRYSNSAIEDERKRLEGVKPRFEKSPDGRSRIEVESETPVSVFVDERPSLAVDPGPHTVSYQRDGLHGRKTDVWVFPGHVTRLKIDPNADTYHETRITTRPDHAWVVVGGRFAGISPTLPVSLRVGTSLDFAISHGEAEPLETTAEVKGIDPPTLPFKLELRPAFISLRTVPAGATVYVDGRNLIPFGRTPLERGWIEGGRHRFTFTRDGYESAAIEVDLPGGSDLRPGPVTLSPIQTGENTELGRTQRRLEKTHLVGIGLRIHEGGQFFGFSLGYEHRLPERWGVEVTLGQALAGVSVLVGAPVFLHYRTVLQNKTDSDPAGGERSSASIRPEVGWAQGGGFRYGGSLGWNSLRCDETSCNGWVIKVGYHFYSSNDPAYVGPYGGMGLALGF